MAFRKVTWIVFCLFYIHQVTTRQQQQQATVTLTATPQHHGKELLEEESQQSNAVISPEAEVSVLTVEGGRADLPCDIAAKSKDDSVYLVLWYRKNSGTPIYSYDSREMTDLRPDRPDLWSEPSAFGDRAHFRVSTRPAVLSVTGVQRFDAGTYTCRVDFRQSPTVYHHVKLDIIVPPQKPLIVDDRGRTVEGEMGIGPFREGESLSLECNVPGGEPLPSVEWYMDNEPIDQTFQQTYEGVVKNDLTIRHLKREHTLSRLRCLAKNNNLTKPVETSVTLKMLFPPQGAEIQGPLQPFTCSRDYYIQCKVWGSNPPAKIEWFRGTSPNHGLRPLKAHNQTVTQGGNVTVSWLHYQPKAGHHHQTLICRGSNDDLMTATSRTVEDYHRMEIFFPPTVELTLGRMVNPEDLEEGDDIYFSCSINANPPAYKLTWWHNGEEVLHDLTRGIIVSNQSLVLQKVTREQAGSYTCVASNVEGDQVSNPVRVSIMYKPVCVEDQNIYGVSEGETAHISCRVDAYPEADTFSWSFNTSSGGMDLSRDSFTNKGSSSLLYYTPKSQMDYGTVLCVAGNVVGRQIVPCIYHVIPAGPPDPPRNCTLSNQTHDSLQVDCQEGFGSGLNQEFHMEVFSELQLLVNITARSPRLVARGLPPGQVLFLRVYASNSKGRSRSVRIDGYTLRMADKHPVVDGTSKEVSEKQDPWSSWALVVFLGITLTLVIIAIAIGLIAKLNTASASQQRRQRAAAAAAAASANRHSAQMAASKTYNNGANDSSLLNAAFQTTSDQSPDVIPHFNGASPLNNGITTSTPTNSNGMASMTVSTRSNGLMRPNEKAQIRSSIDMVRVYNYGPASLQQSNNNPMKDVMFRSTNSAGGGQGQPPLYSPAAASDSSGFSEHTSGAPPGGMFSPPGISSFCNPALRPHYESGGGGGVGHGGQGRSLSPQIPHTYHNPTLMASPYSTLPRKPGHRMGVNNHCGPPPIMASSIGRNSPLLELAGVSSNRSSSLGRNTSLIPMTSEAAHMRPKGAPPLLDDDRESCV